MRCLSRMRERILAEQKTPPNWEECLSEQEEQLLDQMVAAGLASVVTLEHPLQRASRGQFYFVTPLGETALACAALARMEVELV